MEGLLPMLASVAAVSIFAYVMLHLPSADDDEKKRSDNHD